MARSQLSTLTTMMFFILMCSCAFPLALGFAFGGPNIYDNEKLLREVTKLPTTFLTTDAPPSESLLGVYDTAAISSDGVPCSAVGTNILKMNGSAADATIASLFCLGVVVTESMGMGGGFYLVYYNRTTKTAYILDARETAPAAAFPTMFEGNGTLSAFGGLAVAVPGALRGYWELYQRFGGPTPWADLLEPAITLCEQGYSISHHMGTALIQKRSYILNEPTMSMFVNPSTGDVYQEGDLLTRPDLAITLKVLQNEPDAIYTGSLSRGFLEDLQNVGSIITQQDLENYRPIWKEPVSVSLENGGLRVFAVPPPGSGIISEFILNILDNYQFNNESIDDNNIDTTYQRITESFKYAYAKRTELGDADFENMTQLIANLTSEEYAKQIYSMIYDNQTFQDPAYYGAVTYSQEDHGTSHLSVLGPNGDAISATSTINLYFGAVVASASTGIVLNDEMDDFSSPNITNNFGIPPSPANFIVPGKRPVSSMSPLILTDTNGDVRLITGASGGSMISSASTWVTMQHIWFGNDIKQSIDCRRLHHQLFPMQLQYEEEFRQNILFALEDIGHNTTEFSKGDSVVTAISKESDGKIYANSDFRKQGHCDGF